MPNYNSSLTVWFMRFSKASSCLVQYFIEVDVNNKDLFQCFSYWKIPRSVEFPICSTLKFRRNCRVFNSLYHRNIKLHFNKKKMAFVSSHVWPSNKIRMQYVEYVYVCFWAFSSRWSCRSVVVTCWKFCAFSRPISLNMIDCKPSYVYVLAFNQNLDPMVWIIK